MVKIAQHEYMIIGISVHRPEMGAPVCSTTGWPLIESLPKLPAGSNVLWPVLPDPDFVNCRRSGQ
jgi:hypothetical protein